MEARTALRVDQRLSTNWQVPLAAVLPFLEGALRAAAEHRRNSSVIKSLRRAENLQVREELIRHRQRCVLLPMRPMHRLLLFGLQGGAELPFLCQSAPCFVGEIRYPFCRVLFRLGS
jgi:Vacuolar sorting protein 39 domain 2